MDNSCTYRYRYAGIMKSKKNISTQACINCSKEGHDEDALYCKYCGSKIHND